MLTNQQKASIHIAKNERGMSDPDYRALLTELTGAVSSTNPRLDDKDYQAIMKAIRGIPSAPSEAKGAAPRSRRSAGCNARGRRSAWQDKQLRKFRQYCKYCGMDETEARAIIFKNFGVMHEEAPTLTNTDFDDIMVTLEELLEERIKSDSLFPGARPREGLDLQYWRNRHPKRGGVNTRESHLIFGLWNDLKAYLGEEKRTAQYLIGFAANVCRLNRAKAIQDLSAREALKVIDALRNRIIQEQKRAAEVPF